MRHSLNVTQNKKIIWVCHSLGGTIVKQVSTEHSHCTAPAGLPLQHARVSDSPRPLSWRKRIHDSNPLETTQPELSSWELRTMGQRREALGK
jgi:hypothetical protein